MAEIKTKVNNSSVEEFILSVTNDDQKRKDSFDLLKLMEDFTGQKARMWGSSIIGFGKYHYKSERSTQEGDWPLLAFSPRKAAISLYVYAGTEQVEVSGENNQLLLLEQLGKYKMGKACIYIKSLSDIRIDILKDIMANTITYLQKKFPDDK